jgi:hypothetical protein
MLRIRKKFLDQQESCSSNQKTYCNLLQVWHFYQLFLDPFPSPQFLFLRSIPASSTDYSLDNCQPLQDSAKYMINKLNPPLK